MNRGSRFQDYAGQLDKKLDDFVIKYDQTNMNKENASKLWRLIQEAGDYLRSQRYTLAHTS